MDAFNTGNVGMMIDSWWSPGALDAKDQPLSGDIGVFALPGLTADETAPVFFGGSDLAVSEKSSQKALATEWLSLLAGTPIQTQLAKEGGVIPNQEAAFVGHEGNEFLMTADEASKVSKFTPVSPCWGNVESSGVLQDMLVKIFTGNSVDEPTAEAAAAITETLNGC
jgi:N,N'-diacetylchitobiose transport system substrate-binding protein